MVLSIERDIAGMEPSERDQKMHISIAQCTYTLGHIHGYAIYLIFVHFVISMRKKNEKFITIWAWMVYIIFSKSIKYIIVGIDEHTHTYMHIKHNPKNLCQSIFCAVDRWHCCYIIATTTGSLVVVVAIFFEGRFFVLCLCIVPMLLIYLLAVLFYDCHRLY